jgi:hypothetical protein
MRMRARIISSKFFVIVDFGMSDGESILSVATGLI